jgi:hypothetical protein
MAGTIVSDTIQNGAGSTVPTTTVINGSAKAWVNFNPNTQVINGSFNIGSITYSAVGKYILNFTTAMPDANYSIVGMQNYADDGADTVLNIVAQIRRVVVPLSTTSAQVACSYNQTAINPTIACFTIFR